jgi:hypothetical protein
MALAPFADCQHMWAGLRGIMPAPRLQEAAMEPCNLVVSRGAVLLQKIWGIALQQNKGGIPRYQLALPVPLHVRHMPLPPHFGQVREVCPLPLTSPEITAIGIGICCKMVPVPLHLRHFPEPWQPEHGVVSLSLMNLSPPIEGQVSQLSLIVRPSLTSWVLFLSQGIT